MRAEPSPFFVCSLQLSTWDKKLPIVALLVMNNKTVKDNSGLMRQHHLCIWPGQQKISHQDSINSEFGSHSHMMEDMEKELSKLTEYGERQGMGKRNEKPPCYKRARNNW